MKYLYSTYYWVSEPSGFGGGHVGAVPPNVGQFNPQPGSFSQHQGQPGIPQSPVPVTPIAGNQQGNPFGSRTLIDEQYE